MWKQDTDSQKLPRGVPPIEGDQKKIQHLKSDIKALLGKNNDNF